MSDKSIPGYTYGATATLESPVTMEEFGFLKRAVLFTAEDERYLRMAGEVLEDQVERVLDIWYGFIAANDFLLHYFCGPDGKPIPKYLSSVRHRFGQWIRDTCNRPYNQEWLDYQSEIAARHHSEKKNETDHVDAAPIVHLRYIIALIYPIVATVKPFLAAKGNSAEEVEKMHQAWFKSVTMQVAIWSRPYTND